MIQVFPNIDALMRSAAELFVVQAKEAVHARRRFNVVLAGGNTPKRAYEILASKPYRERVDWDGVHIFWSDERCVQPDNIYSNFHMTRLALLDHISIPTDNVHRMRGELSPREGAVDYEAELNRHFGSEPTRFDLVFLGMGTDGHTASLFPRTSAIHERSRRAAEVYDAESNMWRVTLTAPVFAAAMLVVVIVSGKNKADVLREVLMGPLDPERLPAQFLLSTPNRVQWFIDDEAAARLPDSARE